MGTEYSDPRFGVRKVYTSDLSGSLASTVAATELERFTFMEAVRLLDYNIYCKTGGTDAVRKIIIGHSLAGTGALTTLATVTLGTQANGTVLDGSITETDLASGDDLVIQHLGTGAEPWNLKVNVAYRERFANA